MEKSIKEILEKYKKNNIELAHAFNDYRCQANNWLDEKMKLECALLEANTKRSSLQLQLQLRTQENEHLQKQLFERDACLGRWRAMFIDVFKCNSAKYMECMNLVNSMPHPFVQSNEVNRTTTQASPKTSLLQMSASMEDRSQSFFNENNRTVITTIDENAPSTSGVSSSVAKPIDSNESDLIRFSHSSTRVDKSNNSINDSMNVTVNRPRTFSIETQKLNSSQSETNDVITQINNSLELLNELEAMQRTDQGTSQETIIFGEEITGVTETLGAMNITMNTALSQNITKSDDRSSIVSMSSDIEMLETIGENESNGDDNVGEAGSSPVILISSTDENEQMVRKRKSDETRLRVPTFHTFPKNQKTSPPKTPKKSVQVVSAFCQKSPRLSASHLSSSMTSIFSTPSPSIMPGIMENSPINSPQPSASNHNNKAPNRSVRFRSKSPIDPQPRLVETNSPEIIAKSPLQLNVANKNMALDKTIRDENMFVKSPLLNVTNIQNVQSNAAHLLAKSPNQASAIKKHKKNKPQRDNRSSKGDENTDAEEGYTTADDNNDGVIRRPTRLCAPTDLREPSLVYKMRRKW